MVLLDNFGFDNWFNNKKLEGLRMNSICIGLFVGLVVFIFLELKRTDENLKRITDLLHRVTDIVTKK